MTFDVAVVDVFQDFAGMPFIILFGLYKILPTKHFRKEICLGFCIEIGLGALPLVVIHMLNYREVRGPSGFYEKLLLRARIL